jgi:hypothetical protein
VVLSPPFFFKKIKMAINVNTVYTTVLNILNKEQRGYLTPDEFNKIATQVQLEIFEKFFEDYNQYIRMPKTDVEFASRMDHIMEEFQVFEKTEFADNTTPPTSNVYDQPTDLHRFGSASWNKGTNSPPIEILSNRDYNKVKLSPLTQPTNNFPVAKYQQDKLTVFPSPTIFVNTDVTFNYIRKPLDVVWAYSVGSLGQYVYEPTSTGAGIIPTTGSVNFEISESQQTEVVLEILKYSGIVIRDPQIIQAASQELAQEEVNSKR